MRNKLLVAFVLCGLLLARAHADVACDGSDDVMNTTTAMSVFMSAGTGTMMTWYKPTGTPTPFANTYCYEGAHFLGDDSDFNLTNHSNLGGGGPVLCGWNYDTWPIPETTVAFTNNAWTHIALVKSGGTLFLYKDGVQVDTVASGATLTMTAVLGVCEAAGGGYPGGIGTWARPQVFPTALSAAEIEAIAKSRLHRLRSSVPSGSWGLDSCPTTADGVTFIDESGNSRTLAADNGANNTGLTCVGNTVLTYGWGAD